MERNPNNDTTEPRTARFSRKLLPLALMAAVMPLGLLACSDDEPSEEEAVAAFCADMASLEASLAAFETVDADTPSSEAVAIRDDVVAAGEAASASAEDALNAQDEEVAALEQAYQDFDEAFNNITGDEPLGAAFESLRAPYEAVLEAEAALLATVDCG